MRLLEALGDLLDHVAQEKPRALSESTARASPRRARQSSTILGMSLAKWRELVAQFKEQRTGVPVKDRTWLLRVLLLLLLLFIYFLPVQTVPCCFVGSQAVDWLVGKLTRLCSRCS